MKKICLGLVFTIMLSFCTNIPVLANDIFDGGDGTEKNPYLISTQAQLKAINDSPSASYKLVNNISLSSFTTLDAFSGNFDGNGFVISRLSLSTSAASDNNGLFTSNSGTIKNLGISISDTQATAPRTCTGGLTGINTGIIENCYSTGVIDVFKSVNSSSFSLYVGGLVGYNSGEITNCYSTANVLGKGINNSPRTSSSGVTSYVGGLTGYNDGFIYSSYASGNVSASAIEFNKSFGIPYCGGFVGYNMGSVENCYALGSLGVGMGTDQYAAYVGGLIGYNSGSSAIVKNCYSTDTPSSYDVVVAGGLIGYNNKGIVTNSFYIESSDDTSTVGTPKTTLELQTQDTYTDWDFTETWDIIWYANDGYPYLRWQSITKPYTVNSISIMDMSGNKITDLSTLGNSFYVEADITKNNEKISKDMLVIALYSTDGILISMTYMKAALSLNQNVTFGGLVVNTSGKQAAYIKAFVWDSCNSMFPLSDELKFDLSV